MLYPDSLTDTTADTRANWQTDFIKMLESQGYQDPIRLDTSWLAVGHVDEFMSFMPASTPRGWKLAVASSKEAISLLEDAQAKGFGNAKILGDLERLNISNQEVPLWQPAERTVDSLLADESLRQAAELAEERIAANLEVMKAETGVTDAEIIRLPVLFKDLGSTETGNGLGYQSPSLSASLTPGVAKC